MKSKTVRLSDEFRLNGNVVEGLTISRHDEETGLPEYEFIPTEYKIGARVMLVSHEDVSPNAIRAGRETTQFGLIFNADDGIGGNSNRNITRYHGWRGTTNDTSCYAHGLREITKIRELQNGIIAITVGADLRPDEE